MLSQAARQGLSAPVNMTWEITLKCNLNCRHCLSDAGKAHQRELSLEECFKVLDQLSELRVFQINVGGGEPFARPNFFDVLEYAQSKGIVSCVSTNGTLLTDRTCQRLAKIEGLFLQVSLDGVDERTNDSIRGDGCYRSALAGMEKLAGHGVKFSINTVLTSKSYSQLKELKELAASMGANLRVSRFRPSGRAKRNWRDLAPSKGQLEDFADWLSRDASVLTGDSFFSLTSERRRRMGLDMCGAAKMTCCLSPDGLVYPCAFLQEPVFVVGDIRKTSLEKLWLDSPVLEKFRSLDIGSCHGCNRFDSCRGGCPAMAYHIYRDVTQPDPECIMQCLGKMEGAA